MGIPLLTTLFFLPRMVNSHTAISIIVKPKISLIRNNKVRASDEDASAAITSLEEMESRQEDLDRETLQEVLSLVQGHKLKLSWYLALRPLGAVILVSMTVGGSLVVFPYHDVMVDVSYWWECILLQCSLVWLVTSALFFMTATSAFLNLHGAFTWKNWLITYVTGVLFSCIFTGLAAALWVYGLRLRYPIPGVGLVTQLFGLGSQIISVWFQLPTAWRSQPVFRRRGLWLMALHVYGMVIWAFYWVMWIVFPLIPEDYQTIMAVVLPLCREAIAQSLSFIGMYNF